MEAIFSAVATFLASALVIWLVSKLNLGLSVTGFVAAIIAAVVIAVVSGALSWLLGLFGISLGGGWIGALLALAVAAVVLLLSDRFVPGLKVNGFVGAIVAALGIGVVSWGLNWVFGLFGIA